jgi:hypothetical protein
MAENRAFAQVYDQVYSMLCYTPGGEDPNKTNKIIQLGINKPINPAKYDKMVTPNNPGGSPQESIEFAILVDQIPGIGKTGNPRGGNIAKVYADIIKNANVEFHATKEQKERYEKARAVLFSKNQEVHNPDYDGTDETIPQTITIVKPTSLYEGYITAKTAYDNAIINYFSKYDSEASKTIAGQALLRKLQKKIDDAYQALEIAGRVKVETALNEMATSMNEGLSAMIANTQQLLSHAFFKDVAGEGWGIDYPIPSSWSHQTVIDEIDQYLKMKSEQKKGLEQTIAQCQADLQNAQAAGNEKRIDACQDKLDKATDKLSEFNDKIADKVEQMTEKSDGEAPFYSDFEFTNKSSKVHEHADKNSFEAGVKMSWGLFSAGGSTSGESTHKSADEEYSDVKITGQIATLQIVRPWFDPTIFSLTGWTNSAYGKNKISSGKADDKDAVLPMYTTALILAKNLSIESAFSSSHIDESTFSISVDAQIGFGPFKFGPKYSHSSSDFNCEKTESGYKITNAGVQIIGYINAVVPACPYKDDPQMV